MPKFLNKRQTTTTAVIAVLLFVFGIFNLVNADTYKWVNNGSVSVSESKYTGTCSKKQVATYTCNSSTKGNKIYDGTDKGSSFNDTGHAWPIYEGENTSTATEYTYDECGLDKRSGGKVNEWECKLSSDGSSSSSSSNSSSSSSFVSSPTITTGKVTNLTSTSATLNATVNGGGASSFEAYIWYMKTGDSSWTQAYGKSISGSGDQDISVDMSGLTAGAKYYYQSASRNSAGTKYGSKKSFTTNGSSSSASSKSYQLTVKKTGYGNIKSTQDDIDGNIIKCGSNCSGSFYENKEITLKAYPDKNRNFVGWSGDKCASGGGTNKTCRVKMDSDKKVMAEFETGKDDDTNEQPLLVTLSGDGSGKVKDSNGEINCGNDCVGKYHTQTVTLKADPNNGSEFDGWGGACDGKSKTCKVEMNEKNTEAKKVTARFNLKNKKSSSSSSVVSSSSSSSSSKESSSSKSSSSSSSSSNASTSYKLKLKVSGTMGQVFDTENMASPCYLGGSGTKTCEWSYSSGKNVTLDFNGINGYDLKSWGGVCEGVSSTKRCTVKMDKEREVVANFE